MMMAEAPLQDPVAEGRRVIDAVAAEDVHLRLTGGVAVALRCPSAQVPPLCRRYADIDAAGRASQRTRIESLLRGLGYQPDEAFNALHGARRLFYWDPVNDRQFDVFVDRVEMCHTIDLSGRLSVDGGTLAPADLLLMKLQVMETNEKDMLDSIALLMDHDFTDDDNGMCLPYIMRLTSSDWGLWRTVTIVVERVAEHARTLNGFDGHSRVHQQVSTLLSALAESRKTKGWRLRSKIGERVRWYELPEEAH